MKRDPKLDKIGCVLILVTMLISISACNMPVRQLLENNQPPSDPIDNHSDANDDGDIIGPEQVWEVSFTLTEQDSGLTIRTGGDVDWEEVTAGEPAQRGIRSGNGLPLTAADGNSTIDYYIQFNIGDDVFYKGNPTSRVMIEVDFLDVGTDTFNIQYDGMKGPFLDTNGIVKTDSGEIKTASFFLCDAHFANRANGDDFRIADAGDGAETITRVAVKLIEAQNETTTIDVDSCGANPFDNQPDSDAIQECLGQMCSGDTAVFTSPGEGSDYQGYLLDKTLFLMLNGAKSDLTFTSSDENDHALLIATTEMKGYVVHLYSKAWVRNPGLIDNIKFQHLDVDGNRDERLCVGPDGYEGGGDDNYGSWQPECLNTSQDPWDTDPWCSAGGLGMNGGFAPFDLYQEYESNPQYWSTGLEVRDVVISNVECGTALSFSGAAGTIADVTVDTAGDHVHASGCASSDPDNEEADWSDGMTLIGPAHLIENNTVINPSDVGIVHFGGRNMVIRNNSIIAEEGNYGAFAGIALHPWWFGINGDYQITGNTVVNNGDSTCGGIHAGINLGGHMWNVGCANATGNAAIGDPGNCLQPPVIPGLTSCEPGELCQIWAYVPAGTKFTLRDNSVTGAQINYLIGGIQFDGEFIDGNNISTAPRDTDWEGAVYCDIGGAHSWGLLDFVAFSETMDGWTPLEVYCTR